MGTKKRTNAPRKRKALFVGASAAALAVAPSASDAVELVGNGTFETGNFVGWTSTESNGALGGCDTRWTVGGSVASTGCSVNNRNPASPIGSFAAYSSFDGNGPQTFSLSQTIAITGSMSNATLAWSDSFGADYAGAPRTMTINIIGTTTTTVYTYVLPFDLPSATGWTSHTLDITSVLNNYVGQNVQLEFLLTIPETDTGPAGAGLDNVSLDVTFGPFDGTPPGLTIDGPSGTQTAPFLVNFNFTEDVVGFDASDVALTNASLSGFSGSGASYSATVTPLADGLVSLDVAAGSYEDAAGNDSIAPSSFSVQADISAPTVVVSGPAGPLNAPFVANFTFSESVADFILGDITVVNGVASSFSGSGTSYSATITPSADGAVDVSVAAGAANDAAGNDNQASNTLSIVADLTAPVITTPGTINVGTDPGLDTAVVSYSVTANDPGNGALTPLLVSGPVSGSAFPIGTTTVSYSATDAAGNVANASFDVIVGDDEDPVIVGLPADINVGTDAGQPTAVVSWTAPTVSDNAAGATITQTAGPAPGSAFPIGATTITYEAEDAAGNIVTASFTVTVSDNEGPAIVSLPADINVNTDAGQPTALVSWTPPTVTDNTPGATITQTAGLAPGSAFPIGVTTITYEAEDAAGNITTASFNVTVTDNEGPAIVGLPADIGVDTDAGQPTAVVNWTAPTVTDNAPGATITQTAGPAPGSAFPIGVTTITYEAEDAAGNTATASFTVTVTDNEGPAIVGLPADINASTDPGEATAVVNWSVPTVTDNAPGATITQTAGPAPGSALPIGVTTITYEAEDAAGNITTASFTITVDDNEGPSIVSLPADINVDTDAGQPTAVVNWTPPTVTDNAPGATIVQTAGLAPGAAFPVGTTTITYQAEDAAGNIATASFNVTVQDAEPPAIVGMPADIAVSTDAGQPTAVVNWTPPTVTDNAPGATITQTSGPAPGSAFPVGVTTITYEAEDAAGNIVTASFTISVEDDEAPVIAGLPSDITQSTDSGLATAVVTWVEPTVSDNAPGATITRTAGPAPGSAFPIGTTTITYEAEDAAGNVVTASFTVTVEDGEAPSIVGLPADIATNTDAGLSTAAVTWTPPTVSDNAPGATITQTAGPAPGSAFPIGVTTITYEAEDAAGNTTAASFTVTVEDNELPVIAGMPADISVNTDAGLPTAVVTWTPPTVSDNTPGATITQTAGPAPGSAFPVGVTTITYQALDVAGNSVTQSFTVTVTDAEPPAFAGFPADITLVVDYPATSAVASWTAPTISDNAPGATITQIAGPASGSTFPLGATTITYRAEDSAGNVVDQSFTVTVTQTAPGSVRLVVQSGEDGSFAFTSPEPDLNLTINTVGGDGDAMVTIRPGVFNLAFALPAGFGILSADCSDNNSSLSEGSQTGIIDISSGELVTCTIVTVDSLTETTRLIGAFMGARANLITQNMPDSDRRIDRLNGRTDEPSGFTAFGMNIGRGDAPFDLSIGEDRANFSFSLAGMRAQRAQNRRDARNDRARWGDGQFDPDWTQSRGQSFTDFGSAGPSDDLASLAASFGEGYARAPSTSREEGGSAYRGAAPASAAGGALPDAGPQRVDVWVEGTYAQFDTNIGDGDFYMLSAGIDWLSNDDLLVGLGAQFDWTDMEGPVAGSSISGQGYLIGPYMTARLREGLYFDGHIAIGRSDNDVSPFGVYEDEVSADRTYLSAALIGDVRKGPWTFRPEGRVTYFREETEAYVDGIGVSIPSLEVKTGAFEFSPTVRYRYELANDSVLTPFASLEGIWTFEQQNTAAFALGNDAFIDTGVRGRVEAGFDYVRPSGMRFSGVGFYDGIGEDNYSSWGAQLRMSWSFGP